MSENQSVEAHQFIRDELADLPSIVYFPILFKHLGLKSVDAAYRRFERGTLGVCVRDIGGRLAVLKVDLATFLTNGEPQEQPRLSKKKIKNPNGRKGKAWVASC